ncbi:hypothetical protein [Streptomyces sp. NPDC046197]|uniref:hypothetical protein n=1 Tax=Streptomyces sp. NPDC046197 TaxID=3154337 RepID=UPI003411D91C
MDPIILTAGTALVSAMATDAWQRTAAAMANLWKKARNTEGDAVNSDQISNELETLHNSVVQARSHSDPQREEALAVLWRVRLQALVEQNPELAADLRTLLQEHLLPNADSRDRARIETLVKQNVKTTGGTVYVSGRDMHVQPSRDTP